MTFGSWRQWTAIGFLTLAGCNGEVTGRETAALGAGGNASESTAAEAGQPSLSDEQLDRLLDALEGELQTQENPRR